MRMFKIVNCFLFVLVLLLTAGCSSVNYSVVHYSNGSISQVFVLDLDSTQLYKNNFTTSQVSQIKTSIQNYLVNYDKLNYNSFQTKMLNDGLSLQRQEEMKEMIDKFLGWKNNTLTYTITFANTTIYYYYHNFNPEENEPEIQTDINLLVTKTKQTATTVFGSDFQNGLTITEYLIAEMKTQLNNMVSESANIITLPQLTYSYVTINPKLKSDADTIVKLTDGSTMHTWNISSAQSSRQINFYTITPRREIWYLGALVLTGLFMLTLFLIRVFTINKKR